MTTPSVLLSILDTEQGQGLILDIHAKNQRRFFIFDGGEASDMSRSGIGPSQNGFHRTLSASARSAWLRGSSGIDDAGPFKPKAFIALGSHDPFQGMVALLEAFPEGDTLSPQQPLDVPFIIPNLVNIESGWKTPPTMLSRLKAINQILHSVNFIPSKNFPHAQVLEGVSFKMLHPDRMLVYGRALGSQKERTGLIIEPPLPTPNSQGILLEASCDGENTSILAKNASLTRIAANCLQKTQSHFSVYQIQGNLHYPESTLNARVAIAQEFSVWALMELGHHKLASASGLKKFRPLTEDNELYAGLSWFLSTFETKRKDAHIYGFEPTVDDGDVHLEWLRTVLLNTKHSKGTPHIIFLLASLLGDAITNSATADNDIIGYLEVLRARQRYYMEKCKMAPNESLEILGRASDSPLKLSVSASDLLERVERRLNKLCYNKKDPKSIDAASEPLRLGIMGFQKTRSGNYDLCPEIWLLFMKPKDDGLVDVWFHIYSLIQVVALSQAFHSKLTADTYFLSPPGSENTTPFSHHYEILGLALAMAASDSRRQASLFLPKALPLDWISMEQMAKLFESNISKLFGADKLALQISQAGGTYVTLNGSGANLETLPDFTCLDLTKVDNNMSKVKALVSETPLSSPSPFPTGDHSLYHVFEDSASANERQYFQIDFDFLPEHPSLEDKGPYPPPFKVSQDSPPFGLKVIEIPTADCTLGHLAIFGPRPGTTKSQVPYRAIPSAKADGKYTLKMEYPEGSGRYWSWYKTPHEPPFVALYKTSQEMAQSGVEELSFHFQLQDDHEHAPSSLKNEPTSLDEFLRHISTGTAIYNPTPIENLTMTQTLAMLLRESVDDTLALLHQRWPTALMQGGSIEKLLIDTRASIITPICTPLGNSFVREAQLVFQQASEGAPLQLGSHLETKFENVKINLKNVGSNDCSIVLSLLASFVGNEANWALNAETAFNPAVDMFQGQPASWSVRFRDKPVSLDEFSSKLQIPCLQNMDSNMMKQSPPYCKSTTASILSDNSIADISFTYQQTYFGLPAATISSIKFDLKTEDWREIVPKIVPFKTVEPCRDGAFSLELHNPLSEEFARISTSVTFTAKIGATNLPSVPCTLSATPLISLDDYEYWLTCGDNSTILQCHPTKIDAAATMQTLSLGKLWDKVATDVPGTNTLFKDSKVRKISIRLKRSPEGNFAGANFEMVLYVDILPLVPGNIDIKFELASTLIHINDLYGVAQCEGKGILWVRESAVHSHVRIPTKYIPGFLTIKRLRGTSFSQISQTSGLKKLVSLTQAANLFQAGMRTMQIQLYSKPEKTPVPIELGSINFRFPPDASLSIANLATLQALQGSFDIQSSACDASPSSTSSIECFYISGETPDCRFSVNVETQGSNEVSIFFYPTEMTSVKSTFAGVLGITAKSPFSDVLDDLLVIETKIKLLGSSTGLTPQHVEMLLSAEPPLTIGACRVYRLKLTCDVVTVPGGSKKLTKLRLDAMGSVPQSLDFHMVPLQSATPGELQLILDPSATKVETASGVLAAFGIAPPPLLNGPKGLKDEDLVALPVTSGSGRLIIKDKSLEITSLDLIADCPPKKTIPLINSRQINLESIYMEISYRQGDEIATATFGGLVNLVAGLRIPVKLNKKGTSDIYRGPYAIELDRKPGQPVDVKLKKLTKRLLPDTEYVPFPQGSGLSGNLSIVSGEATFIAGERASIAANFSVTQWSSEVLGLTINFNGLEGRVRVDESTRQSWTVALIGETEFGPFVSSQGVLQLSDSRKPMLAARLSKVSTGKNASRSDDVGYIIKSTSRTQETWDSIRPKDQPKLTLDLNTSMYADLSEKSVLFTGSVKDLGAVGIAIRNKKATSGSDKAKCEFFVVLGIPDPSALWKELAQSLSQHFTFKAVHAYFASADWEVNSLKAMADDATITANDLVPVSYKGRSGFNLKDSGLNLVSNLLAMQRGQPKIQAGAQFEAIISFDGDKDLTKGLQETCEPGTSPTLRLFANINGPATKFGVSMDNFTFFGGDLILTNCEGSFVPKKVTPPSTEGIPTLDLNAELRIKTDSTKNVLRLATHVEIDKQKVEFATALDRVRVNDDGTVIKDPFATSLGLTFKAAEAKGTIYFKKSGSSTPPPRSSVKISGTVQIDNTELTARLIFDGLKPRVLSISFSNDISMETISKDLIINDEIDPGRMRQWPSESFPPITFGMGKIYYANLEKKEKSFTDPDDAACIFSPGFNIVGTIGVFDRKANVEAQYSNKVMTIRGRMQEPIDLGWLLLENPEHNTTHETDCTGPRLEFVWNRNKDGTSADTNIQTNFKLHSFVTLFQSEKLRFKGTMAWIAEDKKWSNKKLYNAGLNDVGNDESDITIVRQNNRWWVNGVNLEQIWENLNLANALWDISKTKDRNKCGELAGMIFDKVLRFQYNFKIDFGFTEGYSNPGIEIRVTPKLRIVLDNPVGASREVVLDEIMLSEWSGRLMFKVPNFEALIQWLGETAEKTLENVATYLLDHPDLLARLIFWMNVKDWGKELIGALVCRDIQPENVKQRYRELFPEQFAPPPKPNPPPEDRCRCTGSLFEQFICNMGRQGWQGR